MRISYFNYEWDPESSSGAGAHMAEMADALERMGHQVFRIDGHRKPAGETGNGRRRRLSGLLWESANYLRSVRAVPGETEILRRQRPDVVLIRHALRFSSLVAARRVGLPVVFEVNAPVPYEIRRYRPGVRLLPGLSDWTERRILAAADGIFVVSNALRDYFLRQGLEPARVLVAPNGADPSQFSPAAADLALRARWPGCTLVGFAGSFARFHGIELLEQAICQTPALQPRVHFVLIGDGPAAQRLRESARHWTFLGRLPRRRLAPILAAMDVLVAPYPAEDFFYFSPLKLFEYMACGRAVLAARLGQIAEVITDGVNGRLYDPCSPEDFLNRLLELLRHPAQRARLGAQARQTIISHYTWDHNAERVERALEQARNRRRPLAAAAAAPQGLGGQIDR